MVWVRLGYIVQGAIISCNETWSHRGRGRSEAFSIRFTIIEQVEAPPLGPRYQQESRGGASSFSLNIVSYSDTISEFFHCSF